VVLHVDRAAHHLTGEGSEVAFDVQAGDVLEIAQWQLYGGWLWAAHLERSRGLMDDGFALLSTYKQLVEKRLASPEGPPLKMYLSGHEPVRSLVGLYSLVLNGFAPERVVLFGEHQWREEARTLVGELASFAHVVPTDRVLAQIERLAGTTLARWASQHWFVMKTCVALLHAPFEFCLMDDDVFVLDAMDDARRAFATHDLVYCGDYDHDLAYAAAWRIPHGAPTRLNAGLYLARVRRPLDELAAQMLGCDPQRVASWVWEQGFLTWAFASGPWHLLNVQRYFYPIIDGLPGGFSGYDYRANPCGFASIHFGGSYAKPDDSLALVLANDILSHARPISHEVTAGPSPDLGLNPHAAAQLG
jgi:hypothetical protein